MPTAEDLKGGSVHYWIGKLSKEEKAHEVWRKQAKEAVGVYFDCSDKYPDQAFNLFYSTIQTLRARLYSKAPNPDVRRRFDASTETDDPAQQQQAAMFAKASKDAAQIIERAINFTVDTTAFYTNTKQDVEDYLIAGLGCPKVRYVADVAKDEYGAPKEISRQSISVEHVPWNRFHWEPGKCWEDVDWVGFDDYLTKDEVKAQFDQEPEVEGSTKNDKDKTDQDKYAHLFRVTTVWYRPTRTIYVIGWNFDEPLKEYKDELALEGFYPCPRPMFANVKSNDLVPTPDYYFSRVSYQYINTLITRIQMLTAQIKSVGFYDASIGELALLAQAPDGTLVPIQNLAQRLLGANTADFTKTIAMLPVAENAAVVGQLQMLLMAEKARLDESNGIADIVRGTTDPNETAKAQQIKSNWANLRLSEKTGEVSRCMRDVFRIMSEIISEHFTPESLYLMTGIQADPMVMQIIQSDVGRTLAIDVETDSTIAIEDEAEKAQRLEFLGYITPFIKDVMPAVQQGLLPGDVAKELMKFALSSFKHGRTLEDAIEAAPGTMGQLQQMQQQLQQTQQQAMQAQQALEACQKQLQQAQGQNAQIEGMNAQANMTKAQSSIMDAQAKGAASAQKAANDNRKDDIAAYNAETDRIALIRSPDVSTTSVI